MVLLVAACSGPPAGSAAPGTPSTAGDGTASAVAKTITAGGAACGDVTPRSVATYVADAVSCTSEGERIIIRTFRSTDDRDRFLEASGGLVKQLSVAIDDVPQLVGPTWVITADTKATAERIRGILGGQIR
jgi:hypothetical protein